MQLKKLTADLCVGPQIEVLEVEELARNGFRSLIGNRPDGEAPDQPAWPAIAAAAREQGMEVRHIPVVASAIGDADVAAFRDALRDLPKPIAAFCKTGTRSTILWALANEASLSADERICIAAQEGFNLEPFRSRLEASDAGPQALPEVAQS